MRRALALAGVLVATPAAAEDVVVPVGDQPAELVIDAAWRAEAVPATEDAPAIVMRHPGGAVLAVTVAMAPNADAWREETRKAYVEAIVDGFDAQPGVEVKAHAVSVVGIVPAVDLELRRGKARVAVRLLLFRTRTIAIAVEGKRGATLEQAARGLVPAGTGAGTGSR